MRVGVEVTVAVAVAVAVGVDDGGGVTLPQGMVPESSVVPAVLLY